MTQHILNFEDKTNGSSIANGTYNGFTVQMGASVSFVADTTHVGAGSMSAKIQPLSGVVAQIAKQSLATDHVAVRMGYYFTALPNSDSSLLYLMNGSTRLANCYITTTGYLRLVSTTGTEWTAPTQLPINQWVWINMYAVAETSGSAGILRCTLDTGNPSAPLQDSGMLTGRNVGTLGSFTAVLGAKSNTSTWASTFWIDNFIVDDAATDIVTGIGAPSAVATISSASYLINASGSSGSSLTYDIAQVSGPSGSAVADGTGKWLVPVPSGTDAVWRVTVTQSDNQEAATNVTVPAMSSSSGSSPLSTTLRWNGTQWA